MSEKKGRVKLPNNVIDKIIKDLKIVAKTYNSQQGMVVKLSDIERILNKMKRDKDANL